MRLIDADALIEKIYEIDKKYGIGAFGDGLEMAKELVLNMPTIETERPHGEWEKIGEMTYRCTRCGWLKKIGLMPYCENCGSDMRVKGELNRVSKELNSEIEKSKSEIVPDYRVGWRLRGEAECD